MFRDFLLWSQNRSVKMEKVKTGFVEDVSKIRYTGFIEPDT